MTNNASSNTDQKIAVWILGFIVLLAVVWVARIAGEKQATKSHYDKLIDAEVDRLNNWKPGTTAGLNK